MRQRLTGRTATQIVEDAILGRERLGEYLEHRLETECTVKGITREVIIEKALYEYFSGIDKARMDAKPKS